MIRICRPVLSERDGRSRVTADIDVDGQRYPLWVEVEDEFADGLCPDRSDAFLVGLLALAFRGRHDISWEAPVTDLLKEQIEKDFIFTICQNEPQLHPVRLSGPVERPIFKGKTVRGMGLSCGVDCLYTVRNRMLDASLGDRYFLMTDAHMRSTGDTAESAARRFRPLCENGKAFARRLGIPLIVVRSNWGPQAIPGMAVNNCTTYCNCFCALSLQRLFTHYYLASGGPVEDFATRYLKYGFFRTDCSNYDLLSLAAYSTPSLRFQVDGLERRVEKVRALVEWTSCHDFLDVCEMHRRRERGNDTYDCHKCMHTVCEILSVGGMEALELFADVFDVDYVRTHRAEYLAYLICQRLEPTSECGREAWGGRSFEGCGVGTWLKAFGIIARKAVRKLIRHSRPPRSWADI